MSEAVRTESMRDGRWWRLIVQQPKGNLITEGVIQALSAAVAEAERQPALRLLTIEGAGDQFSYGASVEEHLPGTIERVLPAMHRLIVDLLAVPVPTGAIVRGRCLGGGFELALACDFLFAAEDAVLGLPEIKLGVFPPAGSALLPARVGAARAIEAVLTGEPRPVAAWREAGLVTMMAPAGELLPRVEAWFDGQLASKSAAALGQAALAARLGLRRQVEQVLPELEWRYLTRLMRTRDALEGLRAFVEKRQPVWEA